VLTPDPSAVPIPNGNAIKFIGDATSLPCGMGMGQNGNLTIAISTAVDPCADANAQSVILKQPWGPSEFGILGPFDADQNICVHLKRGGSCDVTNNTTVDYNPGGATAPASSSASLLACETRFQAKVRAFARFDATKMHSCTEKVV